VGLIRSGESVKRFGWTAPVVVTQVAATVTVSTRSAPRVVIEAQLIFQTIAPDELMLTAFP
jgi:hypothetical protein